MNIPRLIVSVCNVEALAKKKIELYSEYYSDIQLSFSEKPDLYADVSVIPAEKIDGFLNNVDTLPLIIAYGSPQIMSSVMALGCSDYLCDPWSVEEFFLRIKIAFSRYFSVEVSANGSYIFLKGGSLFCNNLLTEKKPSVKLTVSEAELFKLFSKNRGYFFSRDQLTTVLNKKYTIESSRAIDMHVCRLKSKINKLCSTANLKHFYNPVQTKSRSGWGIF